MIELIYKNESVEIYHIDNDDECECSYDDEMEVVEYCNKNVCPNL